MSGKSRVFLQGTVVDEVLATNSDKSYLRKESIISQIVSKDLNKSLAVASFSTTSFKNEPSVSRIVLVTAICY